MTENLLPILGIPAKPREGDRELIDRELIVDEIPGVVYRFAKAGSRDESFGEFAGAIKAAFIKTLEARSELKKIEDAGQVAIIKEKIKAFVDSRIVVELVE